MPRRPARWGALLQVLQNLVNMLGIPSSLNFAVMGAVILLGVIAAEQACAGDGGTPSDNAAEAGPRRGLKASLNESSGGAVAACTGLRLLSTIHSCFINQQTRSAITGRHGPRARAKPENPLQVGLWRPTNLSTIDTC
jgi:hypothetical protein